MDPTDLEKRLSLHQETWGFQRDIALVLAVLCALIFLLAPFLWAMWIEVGWRLLLAALGTVFVPLTIFTALTVPFATLNKFVLLGGVSARRTVQNRDANLKGELLDGLWLPFELRIASWLSLPILASLGVAIALSWAPPTRHAKYLADLERSIDASQAQGDFIGSIAAKQELEKQTAKPTSSLIDVRQGPPDGSRPSVTKREPTTAATTRPTTGPQNGGRIVIHYDPVRTKTSTKTTTSTSVEKRSGNAWFKDLKGTWLPVPLVLVNNLLGLGLGDDPDEYVLRVTTVTQRVVENQELTPTELDELLAKVSPANIEEAGRQLVEIIKDRQKGDQKLQDMNVAAVEAAVKRARAARPLADSDEFAEGIAKRIAEHIEKTPPTDVPAVIKELTSELLSSQGGKFPSPEARGKVITKLRERVADETKRKPYEDAIMTID